MPGSVGTSHSASSGSRGSRKARTRQYRTVAATSQVDESLFGAPHREVMRREMLEEKYKNDSGNCASGSKNLEEMAAARHQRRSAEKAKKPEVMQIVTKDMIRTLRVPSEDPSGQSVVLTRGDYHRLLHGSRVLSKEERERLHQATKQRVEDEQDGVQERKNYIKMHDLNRRENEPLNDLEEEQRKQSEHLKQAAMQQLQEQEDEIKRLNELINNAKCHAIRDAQIVEKGVIAKELKDEEMRLDRMMEVERQNALTIQQHIEKTRLEERLLGAQEIQKQISEREQEKLLEEERKDQENVAMQKYLDKLCEEETEKLERKVREQVVLRDQLNEANVELRRRKEEVKEQERLQEAKVLEYQRQKAEREAEYEEEQEKIRREKEREVARLRALQERAKDEAAERDALRAKRAQEEAEREWRAKEAAKMRKDAETEALLKVAREQQQHHKEHYLAVQAQRDREEFERVLQAQKEIIEDEKRREVEVKERRKTHADAVRQQIRTKEQERIKHRNDFFEEGKKLDEEARRRRELLEHVKQKKLDQLRAAGIHDKYLAEVERKANRAQQHIAA